MTWIWAFRFWLLTFKVVRHFRKKNPATRDWQRRLDMVRAKHERSGGPDEQQLADWGRSS